jgi:urease accessory protein
MRAWLFLQLADSAFPAGGFAHSAGLEAAVQAREVSTRAELRRFAEDALWQAGRGALPLLSAAHEAPARLAELDAAADLFLVNHIANRASRTQGRAFVDTCARIFPIVASLRAPGLHLHYAPIFGAALRALELPLPEAQQIFLWLTLRGVLSSAVRLGACGTHQAQQLTAQLAPALDAVLRDCASLTPESLAQTAPLSDLLSATHDRLYSRLFVS